MNKMPQLKTKTYLEYDECAEYIAHRLEVKDLRDFSGKYDPGRSGSAKVAYQDFWHLLCEAFDIRNGQYIYINSDFPHPEEDWQKKICEAFISEFGENAQYWVEW